MPRANLLLEEEVLSLSFCPMHAPTDVKGATRMEHPGHLPGKSTVGEIQPGICSSPSSPEGALG